MTTMDQEDEAIALGFRSHQERVTVELARQAARNKALEEAASVAEHKAFLLGGPAEVACLYLAEDIRALKREKP